MRGMWGDGRPRPSKPNAHPGPALFQPQAVAPRHNRADREGNRECDHGDYDPVINGSAKVILLQGTQPIFCQLHTSRLPIPHDHIHFCFQLSQLFQNLLLKVADVHANHHRQLYSADFVVCLFHKFSTVSPLSTIGATSKEYAAFIAGFPSALYTYKM